MGNQKLTEEQKKANEALKSAKTPEEKEAAEKLVEIANENAEQAEIEAENKKQADKLERSRNTPLLKKTKGNYVPEPGTEKNYHALIEVRAFNNQTGERASQPQVQIFAPKAFKNFAENCVGLGYTVDILHDPSGEYPDVGIQAKKQEKKED